MVRRAIRKKEILHSLSHHSISIGFLAISIYCFSLTWNMWRIVGVFCFHENHGEKRCRENVMYSLTTEVMNSNFLLLLLSLLLSYMFKWGYQTNDLQTVGIAISTMASHLVLSFSHVSSLSWCHGLDAFTSSRWQEHWLCWRNECPMRYIFPIVWPEL